MDRVKSGINGLDDILLGGYPRNASVLVCGSPGTGKSIFGLQFIYRGIVDSNENGLYVSIEEEPEDLKMQAQQFGWNFYELEEQNRAGFLKIPIDEANLDIVALIREAAEKIGAKRIVVDSLSILSINAAMYRLPITVNTGDSESTINIQPSALSETSEIQQFIYIFMNRIGMLGDTTVFITDAPDNSQYLTRDTVSEFACDGLIQLKLETMGNTVNRTLLVRKMRGTAMQPVLHLLNISENGLDIRPFGY